MQVIQVLFQNQNLYLVSSIIISILLYYFGLKVLHTNKNIMDLLLNTFIYGLLIWKFSYILIHTQTVLHNPISILYFNGGTIGIGIASVFVIFYTWVMIRRTNITWISYIKAAIPVYLGYFSTFMLINVSSDLNNIILILQVLVAVGFFVIVTRNNTGKQLVHLLIWFHLLQFELALFNHHFLYSGLVSTEVIYNGLFVVLLLIVSYWMEKQDKETTQGRMNSINQLVIGILLVSLATTSIVTNTKPTSKPQTIVDTAVSTGLNKGQVAPDFELQSVIGTNTKLSDYRGKVVILNFWASWCPPCKAEIPELVNYYEAHKNEQIEIVGVNLTKSESNSGVVKDFVKNNSMTFPILLDEQGKIGDLYRTITIPTSYIIDKNGVIQDKYVGAMSYETINKFVSSINK
ncbi:peroxiredoxin family protein [Ectobacillus sp. sgz5001026]|uniref:peroxiredoxin family protein n=1 Tax=Ectobacillus sp. sgz5001026 TaxID=3242473 RepID=UPI0036D23F42